MATKAELQAAHEHCERIRHEVVAELHNLDFLRAVKLAETALPHQHAAITFQRRYHNTAAPTAPIIEVILRYAPALFLNQSLDTVESWYFGGTKTERSALPHIPKLVASARNVLVHAVDLWGRLTESSTVVLRLTPDLRNNALFPIWLSAAVVAADPNEPTAYSRVTDFRRDAVAKCARCGRERRAPVADLLEPSRCPACKRRSEFVLIRRCL